MAPSAVTFADHRGIPGSPCARPPFSEHETTPPVAPRTRIARPQPIRSHPCHWPGHGLVGAGRRSGCRGQPAEGRHHRRAHRRPDRQLSPDRQRRSPASRAAAGADVVKVYSPRATWSRVRTAVAGANVVVYLGHGNGSPSPYSSSEWPDRHNGWGLNRTTKGGDSDDWSTRMVYCGEKALLGTLSAVRRGGPMEPLRRQDQHRRHRPGGQLGDDLQQGLLCARRR